MNIRLAELCSSEFVQEFLLDTYSKSSWETVHSVIKKLTAKNGEIQIENLTDQDVLASLSNDLAIGTYNSNMAFLSTFFDYLTKKGYKHSVNGKVLDYRKQAKSEDKKKKARVLTIEQIIAIRQGISGLPAVRRDELAFTFEMIYRYGLNRSQLSQCTPKSYNKAKRIFGNLGEVFTSPLCTLGDDLVDIIEGSAGWACDAETHSRRINSILTKELRLEVLLQDVRASHKSHSALCPWCNKRRLLCAENWHLIQLINLKSQVKWFICRYCTEEKVTNEEAAYL